MRDKTKHMHNTVPNVGEHLIRTWGYALPDQTVIDFTAHIWPHIKWVSEEMVPRLMQAEKLTTEEYLAMHKRFFENVLNELPEHRAFIEAGMMLIDKAIEALVAIASDGEWSAEAREHRASIMFALSGVLDSRRNKAVSKTFWQQMLESLIPVAQHRKSEPDIKTIGEMIYGHEDAWIAEAYLAKHKNW